MSGAKQDWQIRLGGSGGQGLILAAHILAEAFTAEGRMVSRSQSYEPTSRGGLSRSDLVVGSEIVDYPLVTSLDVLLILDPCARDAGAGLLALSALVLSDSLRIADPPRGEFSHHALPFTERARALGNERAANLVALGAIAGLTDCCTRPSLEGAVRARAPRKWLQLNLDALAEGYRLVGREALAEA